MMTTTDVKCKSCGQKLIYRFISDAHDPNCYSTFEVVKGKDIQAVECCPSCGNTLDKESVVWPKPKKEKEKNTITFKAPRNKPIPIVKLLAVRSLLERGGIGAQQMLEILCSEQARKAFVDGARVAYWTAHPVEIPNLTGMYDSRMRKPEYRELLEKAILEVLEWSGPLDISEFIRLLTARNIPRDDVVSTLLSLVNRAQIVHTRKGLYALPKHTTEKPAGGWF